MRIFYGTTNWRREIGIDGGYLGVYDGIVALRCPDCGEEFPRDNSKWALEMFEKYKELINKNPHTGSSFDEFIEKEGLDINEKK